MADILDYCAGLEPRIFDPGAIILPEGERLGRLYEIPDALTFLDTRPEFSLAIAAMLARRLYYTTSYLVDLQQQSAGKRQDLDLVDQILQSLVDPSDTRRQGTA